MHRAAIALLIVTGLLAACTAPSGGADPSGAPAPAASAPAPSVIAPAY